jgi:hypothetical protein
MSRRRGATLTKALLTLGCLLAAPLAQAISVGNLTFSCRLKRISPANGWSITIKARGCTGSPSAPSTARAAAKCAPGRWMANCCSPPPAGAAGRGERYFKFYYHGPRDNRERYYRVSFREIPTRNLTRRSPTGGEVSMEPVVVMDTILVVRPREVQFKWSFDKAAGTVSNTGNTWFKLLIKPGCDSTEEEGTRGICVPGTWFASRRCASRGTTIWSITTNLLRSAIPVR